MGKEEESEDDKGEEESEEEESSEEGSDEGGKGIVKIAAPFRPGPSSSGGAAPRPQGSAPAPAPRPRGVPSTAWAALEELAAAGRPAPEPKLFIHGDPMCYQVSVLNRSMAVHAVDEKGLQPRCSVRLPVRRSHKFARYPVGPKWLHPCRNVDCRDLTVTAAAAAGAPLWPASAPEAPKASASASGSWRLIGGPGGTWHAPAAAAAAAEPERRRRKRLRKRPSEGDPMPSEDAEEGFQKFENHSKIRILAKI